MHDRHRVLADGSGTARRILGNIETMVRESRQNPLRVRTVTSEPSLLAPLHRYLYDLGFNDLYVQAAYDGEGLGGRDRVLDLVELARWYRELLLAGVVVGVYPFTAMLERLSQRGAAAANWYPCTAGVHALGVGPDGHLFLCHHFLDEPTQRLGHVADGFPDPIALQERVRSVEEREPCASCWARHLCGGECYHRALTAGLGYFGVNEAACDTRRAYATAALDLFTRVGGRRPGALQDLLDGAYHRPIPASGAYAVEDLSPYLD
jgi:uncharacterized protein